MFRELREQVVPGSPPFLGLSCVLPTRGTRRQMIVGGQQLLRRHRASSIAIDLGRVEVVRHGPSIETRRPNGKDITAASLSRRLFLPSHAALEPLTSCLTEVDDLLASDSQLCCDRLIVKWQPRPHASELAWGPFQRFGDLAHRRDAGNRKQGNRVHSILVPQVEEECDALSDRQLADLLPKPLQVAMLMSLADSGPQF